MIKEAYEAGREAALEKLSGLGRQTAIAAALGAPTGVALKAYRRPDESQIRTSSKFKKLRENLSKQPEGFSKALERHRRNELIQGGIVGGLAGGSIPGVYRALKDPEHLLQMLVGA